jgi:ribosomal protein S18 acetylase RimI-like enzyme
MQVSLRTAVLDDEAFLRRVHAAAHCDGFSLMHLEPEAVAALVRMQFDAQRSQYRAGHPHAVDSLVVADGEPVGRCWTGETAGELRLLDLAVLPAHRRNGIAGSVLDLLLERARAARLPLRLSVWSENAPALALYRSRGIGVTTSTGAESPTSGPATHSGHLPGHRDLEWLPSPSRVR